MQYLIEKRTKAVLVQLLELFKKNEFSINILRVINFQLSGELILKNGRFCSKVSGFYFISFVYVSDEREREGGMREMEGVRCMCV